MSKKKQDIIIIACVIIIVLSLCAILCIYYGKKKDDFIFNESDPVSYRQLGNSVNVKLVKMFAEALLNL